MIKPSTLWGLFKDVDDSKWLGDICRALGGQDVELDYGQQRMVASIRQDSEWMDERSEKKRENWRLQKRRQRERTDLPSVPPDSCPPVADTPVLPTTPQNDAATRQHAPLPSVQHSDKAGERALADDAAIDRVVKRMNSVGRPISQAESDAFKSYVALRNSETSNPKALVTRGDLSKTFAAWLEIYRRNELEAQRRRNGGKTDVEIADEKDESQKQAERISRYMMRETDDD